MGNKFDYIIITSHDQGRMAFCKFINVTNEISCLDHEISLLTQSDIITYLNNASSRKFKGICLDARCSDEMLDFIFAHAKKDFLLICLWRDPLDKLISIINHNVDDFAYIITGCCEHPLSYSIVYQNGTIYQAIDFICRWNFMNTLTEMCDIIDRYKDRLHIVSIDAIAGNRIFNTLNEIYKLLTNDRKVSLKQFSIPGIRYYSRENQFMHLIRPFIFEYAGNDYSVKPVPIDYFKYEPDKLRNLLLVMPKADCGFTLGDFSGELGFMLIEDCQDNIKNDLKHLLARNKNRVIQYCHEMSQRHDFAQKFINMLSVSADSCLDIMKENINTGRNIYHYLQRHINLAANIMLQRMPAGAVHQRTIAILKEMKQYLTERD